MTMFRASVVSLWLAVILGTSAVHAQPVRIGVIGILPDAGIFVALEKGYFREAGVDLKLEPFVSSVKMLPALSTGDLEIATGGVAASLFNGIARGLPIITVADKGSNVIGLSTNAVLLAKAASDRGEVRSIKDLRGKPIAIMGGPGALSEYQWARVLEREGLTLKDVDQKYMSFPDMITALGTGAIVAGMSSEPNITLAVKKGIALKWISWAEVQPNHQAGVIFYNVDFARKRPEAARGFMVAYVRGIRAFHDALREGGEKKAELVRIMIKHTNLKDPEVYRDIEWSNLNPDGAVIVKSVADQQDFFVKMGRVEKPVPIEKVVDNSFADHAAKVLGPYRR